MFETSTCKPLIWPLFIMAPSFSNSIWNFHEYIACCTKYDKTCSQGVLCFRDQNGSKKEGRRPWQSRSWLQIDSIDRESRSRSFERACHGEADVSHKVSHDMLYYIVQAQVRNLYKVRLKEGLDEMEPNSQHSQSNGHSGVSPASTSIPSSASL